MMALSRTLWAVLAGCLISSSLVWALPGELISRTDARATFRTNDGLQQVWIHQLSAIDQEAIGGFDRSAAITEYRDLLERRVAAFEESQANGQAVLEARAAEREARSALAAELREALTEWEAVARDLGLEVVFGPRISLETNSESAEGFWSVEVLLR